MDDNPAFTQPKEPDSSGDNNSRFSHVWYSTTNDNSNGLPSDCSGTDCKWDVGSDTGAVLTLGAETNESIEGLTLDFAVNDSDIGNMSPDDATTGSSGEATTDLTANENRTVAIYVASGGTSDVINITVENLTDTAVGSVPSGPLAYANADNDLEYDSGETTYTESELYDFDQGVNLVIPSAMGGGAISNSNIWIAANKITSRVDLRTTNDNVTLAVNAGPIEASGVQLGSAKDVMSIANGDVSIDDLGTQRLY